MARTLAMHRVTVPTRDREKYLRQVSERARHYLEANCRFWVFEDSEMRGAFVEFVEADSADILLDAHKDAPGQILEPRPIYNKVEIL